MPSNRSIPACTIIPELAYADVRAAAAWLVRAFGFAQRLRIGDHRVQLTYGDGAIVAMQGTPGGGGHRVMVRVDDVDAHHAHALAAGARIAMPPTSFPYGERQYAAVDIGGHAWVFTQSIADVDPASWGGELVTPSGETG